MWLTTIPDEFHSAFTFDARRVVAFQSDDVSYDEGVRINIFFEGGHVLMSAETAEDFAARLAAARKEEIRIATP